MISNGPQSAVFSVAMGNFSDEQGDNTDNSSKATHQSKSSSKPALQIALPPPPTPAELGLQENANVDTTSTPDLSRKVAEASSPNVSAKEFDGMSRDQLIARLVALEKEKRTSQRSSPSSSSNPGLPSPPSAPASASTTATDIPNHQDTDQEDDEDQEDDDDDDDDDEEEDDDDTLSSKDQAGTTTKQQSSSSPSQQPKDTDTIMAGSDDQQAASTDPSNSVEDRPASCGWLHCGQQFDNLQLLIAHISESHVGSGKASYRCEWENCARNQKPFTKRHKMFNHLRTHTGERPFVCKEEGKFGSDK
jgi:hypothetical protein